ncbi:hypothetical protein HF526_03910 [Pseudonocardia sp. K10HN5]|uniref:Alanine dehydrogenase/pyridine nucleotide transhydrogenase NAD(H)-binding domain-containing protein n=2 Tax=Pseudonocardia acidicola TaxID=2724939 RepID=A0ABX1S884_9PSEU|nr:hypothetical protein [Pseudonocardia acidicola]
MPAAVPDTSTRALTDVTLPYVLALGDRCLAGSVTADPALAAGVTVARGRVVQPQVAAAHGLEHVSLAEALP